MMNRFIAFWAVILGVVLLAVHVNAQEMRIENVKARQAEEQLLNRAQEEKKAALEAEARSRSQILSDRNALIKAIRDATAKNQALQKKIAALTAESDALSQKEKTLSDEISTMDGTLKELVGVIRVFAKDLGALVAENPQSTFDQQKEKSVGIKIADQDHFPGMADIRQLTDRLFREIRRSGEVSLTRGPMVDRSGKKINADILTIGTFTAAYATPSEVGFLAHSPSGEMLFALSRLPQKSIQKELTRYMTGSSDSVTMDISRGGALRQLTHQLSLLEQIPKGGLIVWPILGILALGTLIVLERIIYLIRGRLDADGLIRRIAEPAQNGVWSDCRKVCREYANHPVGRVVTAGLECCQMKREELETALQEAILREIPPMERFLSTLGMLAAIAPLLGLLGTVTGMIDTFHVITQQGTGDPRLMSGGISEALVTTMLGLSVAIPIMLAHTLLNRAVETRIGQLEEKAVAFVNLIQKSRHAS